MKHVKLINDQSSVMIDDSYFNYRLLDMRTAHTERHPCGGVHLESPNPGKYRCTFPYSDYLTGQNYDADAPQIPTPKLPEYMHSDPLHMTPVYYMGSPYSRVLSPFNYAALGIVRPGFFLEFEKNSKIKNNDIACYTVAIGSAMPNIVYSFTHYATSRFWGEDPDSKFNPFVRSVNMWQRRDSINGELTAYHKFYGENVGFTELKGVYRYGRRVLPQKEKWGIVDTENFKLQTFEQEAKNATTLFIYGVDREKTQNDRGEFVVKNEQGQVIFNNRYDYMRVLQYIPTINALEQRGEDTLYNAPKRFTFPGRKIAVVSSQEYHWATLLPQWGKEYSQTIRLLSTGFWFPDPSTVEFTTCISDCYSLDSNDSYMNLESIENGLELAELHNVMILDVTGCTPGWCYEAGLYK